jgi:aryl-alcohol dehydrogenase-like predicted oxidoreductase
MKYRKLLGTDLKLSVVGMGCWAIGKKYWGDDVRDSVSIKAIQTALDVGINWFDTAPLYGDGHSDAILIRALQGTSTPHYIATKVGILNPGPTNHAESKLDPKHIRADLEASLKRLNREHIDLLQVHWPCQYDTPYEDTFGELTKLQQEGKIRHIGVCNYNAGDLPYIMKHARLASLQTPYSLLRREFEQSLQPMCKGLGIGVLAYEPLCRGLLSGKYTDLPRFPDSDMRSRDDRFTGGRFSHGQRFSRDIARVGSKVGLPAAAVAIGWVCAQPGITAAIAGAKTPEQVKQNALAHKVIGQTRLLDILGRIASLHGGW